MMRRLTLAIYSALLVGLVAWPELASAAKISTGQDPAIEFSSFRTFAWKEGKPAQNPRAQNQIVAAVEGELVARGLTKIDLDADLYVMSFVLVDKHTRDELADPVTWEFWTGVQSVRVTDVKAGTLVVDLVDASSEQIVWRGLVTSAISQNNKKNRGKIDKLVRKMFKKFPGVLP